MKYQEIADRSGFGLSKVKQDKARGKFDPDDEQSVAAYIEAIGAQSAPTPQPEGDQIPADHADYVDEHTLSADKGWIGSRDHLLSLPIGTVYRGFRTLNVEICEDRTGKFMKFYPSSLGANERLRTVEEVAETVDTFRKIFSRS